MATKTVVFKCENCGREKKVKVKVGTKMKFVECPSCKHTTLMKA